MDNQELAHETLLEANNYIKNILNGIDYIVENFLAGREDLALNSFVNFVDGMKWLMEVIDLTKEVLDQLEIEFPVQDKVLAILNEMIEAFENRDYVLVGDLLNYEFKPLMEEWNDIFELIASKI